VPGAGAGDVDHVEVVFLDDPVQVRVDKVLPGRRTPVPQQHLFHVCKCQRTPQQRIVVKKNLADRQIVGGAPVSVNLVEQCGREFAGFHGLSFPCESRLRTQEIRQVIHFMVNSTLHRLVLNPPLFL
jgi:hypothetical protein